MVSNQQQTSVNFNNLENNASGGGSFVLTPDYIQQTIKDALKQDNLNPDIEEKLINFQKYQEERTGGTAIAIGGSGGGVVVRQESPPSPPQQQQQQTLLIESQQQQESIESQSIIQQSIINVNNYDNSLSSPPNSPVKVRKRHSNKHDDDEDWVMDTPRKRNNVSSNRTHYGTRGGVHVNNSPILSEEFNDLDEDSDLSQDEDRISTQVNRKVAAIKREMERKKPNYQVMVSEDQILCFFESKICKF